MVNGKVAEWVAEVVAEDMGAAGEVVADAAVGVVEAAALAVVPPKSAMASYPNQPIFGQSFFLIKINNLYRPRV